MHDFKRDTRWSLYWYFDFCIQIHMQQRNIVQCYAGRTPPNDKLPRVCWLIWDAGSGLVNLRVNNIPVHQTPAGQHEVRTHPYYNWENVPPAKVGGNSKKEMKNASACAGQVVPFLISSPTQPFRPLPLLFLDHLVEWDVWEWALHSSPSMIKGRF